MTNSRRVGSNGPGRRRRRSMTAALVGLAGLAAVVIGMSPAQVAAQDDGPPIPIEYGESGLGPGSVQVEAGIEWLPVGGSDGSGTSCETWSIIVAVDDDFEQPVNRDWRLFGPDGSLPFIGSPDDLAANLPAYMRHFSPTGRWFGVSCDGVVSIAAEGGPPVNVAGLVDQAVDTVAPGDPQVVMAPAEMHVTQMPSWLAIDPAYWNEERRATAAAGGGRVVVEANVVAVESLWDMGDGTVVECEAGTVWAPGLDPAAPSCGHIYKRTSLGTGADVFDVTTTVRFRVDVTTNIPNSSFGPFQMERQSVQSIEVGEIQAVND